MSNFTVDLDSVTPSVRPLPSYSRLFICAPIFDAHGSQGGERFPRARVLVASDTCGFCGPFCFVAPGVYVLPRSHQVTVFVIFPPFSWKRTLLPSLLRAHLHGLPNRCPQNELSFTLCSCSRGRARDLAQSQPRAYSTSIAWRVRASCKGA